MRTVIIRNYAFDPPREIGRATLQADGTVKIFGFPDREREHYEQEGIRDFQGREDDSGRLPVIPVTNGARFLDVLKRDFSGRSYAQAEEVDA